MGNELWEMLAHLGERFFEDPGRCCRMPIRKASISTEAYHVWSFDPAEEGGAPVLVGQNTENGEMFEPTLPLIRNRFVQELDGIHVVRSDAAELYGRPILSAERTWIAAMPHTLFMIDRIESERPVKVRSHFVLNNRDNRLMAKVAAETKLVFRRNGAGIKFFQVSAMSDGEENRNVLSFEESASVFRYTSESRRVRHTIVYAAVMDGTDEIRDWHIVPLSGRHFYAEPPDKTGGYSLEMTDGEDLIVHDRTGDRKYRIGANEVFCK